MIPAPVVPVPVVPTPAESLLTALAGWAPLAPGQQDLKAEYEALVRASGPAALSRDGGPEHLTGSCFVLSPDLTHVLLCFHRKGQFWVQLGGHVEPEDGSLASAAYREAREEGGIEVRPLDAGTAPGVPFDLDRHALSGSFGSCRVHWDLGFVALADVDAVPVSSEEAESVAWFAVDALPAQVPAGFEDRLGTVLAELAHRRGAAARS